MEPFILFGDQHVSTMIWTGIIIVLFCILGNFINTKSQDLVAKLIGLSLIIFEITKPFIYIFGFIYILIFVSLPAKNPPI